MIQQVLVFDFFFYASSSSSSSSSLSSVVRFQDAIPRDNVGAESNRSRSGARKPEGKAGDTKRNRERWPSPNERARNCRHTHVSYGRRAIFTDARYKKIFPFNRSSNAKRKQSLTRAPKRNLEATKCVSGKFRIDDVCPSYRICFYLFHR